jgi:hypothetical protein
MKFKMFSAGAPDGIVKDVNEWLSGVTGIAIRHTETKFTLIEPDKTLLLFSVWYDE